MKITKRQLRKIIRESLLLEIDLNPINWVKDKASKEFDEAKFRIAWDWVLTTTLDPFVDAKLKRLNVEGKRGERIAQAWKAAGHEKFVRAAKELEGNSRRYFYMLVNGFAEGGNKWADPSKFSQQIDDLFNEESELYKKVNKPRAEKLKDLWNKYLG